MKIFSNKKRSINNIFYASLYLVSFWIIYATFAIESTQIDIVPLLRKVIIAFACILVSKYFVNMMIAPWHDVKEFYRDLKTRNIRKTYKPRVSVLIPAWNEEVGILTTVKSVLLSEYKNVELIVLNDGSTDRSDVLMKSFARKYRKWRRKNSGETIDLIYHYQENTGKAGALNKGLDIASGEIIITFDADCLVTKECIGGFVKHFADENVAAAVGNVKIGNTQTVIGMVQSLEFFFSFYFKKAESLTNSLYIIGGAAGAFRRKVFDELGGFHHGNITEDIELSMRVRDHGWNIVYAEDSVVYTEGASSMIPLIKQRLRWKKGRFQTFYQYRHMFFSQAKKHNPILTNISLPLAMFGELQLLLEPYFVILLIVYSFMANDFSAFVPGMIIIGAMFATQAIFNPSSRRGTPPILYIIAPVSWAVFYVSSFVEANALYRTIVARITGQEIVWQSWKREGVVK